MGVGASKSQDSASNVIAKKDLEKEEWKRALSSQEPELTKFAKELQKYSNTNEGIPKRMQTIEDTVRALEIAAVNIKHRTEIVEQHTSGLSVLDYVFAG